MSNQYDIHSAVAIAGWDDAGGLVYIEHLGSPPPSGTVHALFVEHIFKFSDLLVSVLIEGETMYATLPLLDLYAPTVGDPSKSALSAGLSKELFAKGRTVHTTMEAAIADHVICGSMAFVSSALTPREDYLLRLALTKKQDLITARQEAGLPVPGDDNVVRKFLI